MLGLLIQLLNIYTVRILRQQCEASITNARLSIKRNTQELFGCCAPRLTFTLLTIGSSARQRQLLLHQHMLPASHAPCVCVAQIIGIFIVRQFAWLGSKADYLFCPIHSTTKNTGTSRETKLGTAKR